MSQFAKYSDYYDIFYRDKDYAAEAAYVTDLIRRFRPGARTILELGCGTCQHAMHLVRQGFSVHGVDISGPMLDHARAKREQLPMSRRQNLALSQGDVRNVRLAERFDVILSLFHVMSYMPDNDSLLAAFRTAAAHVADEGVFIFDFWYGPGVLTQHPEIREKVVMHDELRFTRVATPELRHLDNVVLVDYDICVEDPPGVVAERVHERHTMHYLFLPEVKHFLGQVGLSFEGCYEYPSFEEPSVHSWNAIVIAGCRRCSPVS